ncbi:MAG: YdcF family protein [Pseudomonadota bacterium]
MDTLFFVLSKLVWGLIRPETWAVLALLMALTLMWRGRTRAAAKALSATLCALKLIAIFPLADLLIGPLERQYPANPDVKDPTHIVVLGGSEVPDLSVAWKQAQLNASGERFLAGISLAHRFPNATLVFTGGSGALIPADISEGTIAETVFLRAGVALERLLIESTSRSTAENAQNTLALLNDADNGQGLLVTSASHMPRAMASFCSAGWQNLTAWPVDFRSGAFWDRVGWNLAGNLQDLNSGAKEWVGFLAYRWSGRISSDVGKTC